MMADLPCWRDARRLTHDVAAHNLACARVAADATARVKRTRTDRRAAKMEAVANAADGTRVHWNATDCAHRKGDAVASEIAEWQCYRRTICARARTEFRLCAVEHVFWRTSD